MKKFLILFTLLLFFNYSGEAQDYEPMIKIGSFWDVYTTDGGFCDYDRRRYQITTDTLINSRQYKKLKLFTIKGEPNEHFPHICFDPPYYVDPNEFLEVDSYLREDIAEKKVYIWAINHVTSEYQEFILYDFNVTQAGDVINNFYFSAGDPIQVDGVEINSDGRKVVYIGQDIYFTEGIGNNGGIIGFNNIIGQFDTLFCWGNDQNQNGCTPVLSIDNYRLAQINIFPNPTSDKISLTNLENNTFKLYSILGKEMSFQFSEENQEIDITHLQQGVYFLEIRGTLNSKRVVKIVKN